MRVLGNVIKSQSDSRLYKAIKLKNDIECLIISDQEAKRSSAAMSVGVGSLQDPLEAQGLAHYLEHMLFMGTKKYPNENDYSNFIAKNFGHSNAYTSQDETNYHFEVASNAFPETLDRFAQFFISPLMSDSSSERELNAVHSEHSKNLLNDMWRKYQLTKHLSKEGHPYKKFSTGNKGSLSNPNLRQMLHSFYNSNYSSNLMKLVVCGNEPLDVMSKLLEEKFSEVPNKNYNKFQMIERPYSEGFYKKIYKILPIQDRKVLELSWALSDKSKYYENPPSTYLSYIFGHEGKGSLLSFLINEGLVTGLSAGGSDAYNCFSEFEIRLSLTKKGVENVKQIIEYILYFVEILKRSEPERWVFEELQNVNKMKFDFEEKKQGMSFTTNLAKKMQNKNVEEILVYPYYMKEWRPDLIKDYLKEMVKENLCVFLEAKEVEAECNLTEPIYQTKYNISDLDTLEARVCPVVFPTKNPYIPTNFNILPLGEEATPKNIHKTSQLEVFFKKDHRFELPKIIFYLKLYFNGTNSVHEYLCRRIYLDMLHEKMREFVYLGDSAETFSGIDFDSYFALDIGFSGFRDSTLKFVQPYFEQVFSFDPKDQKYFETVKEKLERSFSNYFLGNPYQLAYNLTVMATRQGASLSPTEKLKGIKGIKFEDIVKFGQEWSKKLYVEAYITGNVDEKQVKETLSQVETVISSKSEPLAIGQIGDIRAVKIPSNSIWAVEEKIANTTEENSAVIVHFQHEASTLRSTVLQELCYNFIKEPAFDYLRTKEQLGYIVMCLPDDNRGVIGMSILLQSSIKTSYELVEYVDIFLGKILKEKLDELDQNLFNQYKESLKTSKQEKDKNLSSEASRFWSEIKNHTYIFDRKEQETTHLESISLEEFKNFVNLVFYMNPKRLEVHLVSNREEEKNNMLRKARQNQNKEFRLLADTDILKKKMNLYPDFYGHL